MEPEGGLSEEENYQYFIEFNKIQTYNEFLKKKVEEMHQEKLKLEKNLSEIEENFPEKKKRIRRKASEIVRNHLCRHCSKAYGSEASLNNHIKIKHK